ncbi:MAG: class I SAM-dependent methyltransferase [Patescibacteria group bacterium]
MHLSPTDQKRISDFYVDALKEYGANDARSVQWMDSHTQNIRFEVFAQSIDLRNKKILDVGCGLGDLYLFLKNKTIPVEYTGIDIIPEFIEEAKIKYPGATFLTQDIFDVTEKYDVVLASGSLNFKVEHNDTYYKDMIKRMYELSSEALIFNMLNSATHRNDATYAAYSPHEISDFCKTLSDNVHIMVDYLPHDFTVCMYK